MNNSAYDPSGVGNQTAIGGYEYTFDAENRMISANLGGGGTEVSSAGYVYDGQGQRVQKITCPAGIYPCTASVTGATALTFVYDAFGDLAAEYGGAPAPSGRQYLTTDHLGSTRLVTNASGGDERCSDYLPFGEEIQPTANGRGACYATSIEPRQKFTGKERDNETGLDYFIARYYSGPQGRFTAKVPRGQPDTPRAKGPA